MLASSTVNRLYGADRYSTNMNVVSSGWTAADNGIMLASGENFHDALSAASIAAAKGIPILLSPRDRLPDSVKSYLINKNVPISYIIGALEP